MRTIARIFKNPLDKISKEASSVQDQKWKHWWDLMCTKNIRVKDSDRNKLKNIAS